MKQLVPWSAGGGVVESLPDGGQRLSIPAGPSGQYRLAQLNPAEENDHKKKAKSGSKKRRSLLRLFCFWLLSKDT